MDCSGDFKHLFEIFRFHSFGEDLPIVKTKKKDTVVKPKTSNCEFSGFKIAWFWKQGRKKLTQRGWWYSGYGLVYHFPLLHAQVIQTVFFSFCCSVKDLVAAREKRQVKVADCVFDSGLSAMFLGRGAVEWNRTCWFYLENALWNPSVCCRLLNVLSYINIYMSIFTVYSNLFLRCHEYLANLRSFGTYD